MFSAFPVACRFLLLAIPVLTACGGTVGMLESSDPVKQHEGMLAVRDAPDEIKLEAIPALLQLSGSNKVHISTEAYETLGRLTLADGRSAWAAGAAGPATCQATVISAKRRLGQVQAAQHTPLIAGVARGTCPLARAWLWDLVEKSDTDMAPGSALYGWLDGLSDEATTRRLITIGERSSTGVDRLEPICALLGRRTLAATERDATLRFVHHAKVSERVRISLGAALLLTEPRMSEKSLVELAVGPTAPGPLRITALHALGDGGLTAESITKLGLSLKDHTSPVDVRVAFSARLAKTPKAAFGFYRMVAKDAKAPDALRSAVLDHVLGIGGLDATLILAQVVKDSKASAALRAKALAGFGEAWSEAAEKACVALCEETPTGELCNGALAHLDKHGSKRLADAKAAVFEGQIRVAKDPITVAEQLAGLGEAGIAKLPVDLQLYASAVSALAALDATAHKKVGAAFLEATEPSVCVVLESISDLAALKKSGRKEDARKLQKELSRAESKLRERATAKVLKSLAKGLQKDIDAAATLAAKLGARHPKLLDRHTLLLGEGKRMKAPCAIRRSFVKALAKARKKYR